MKTEEKQNAHPVKKGAKEYLLEGFMIFVAVTMGFIAENIREKISENQKELEFIESLVEDLKEDQIYLDDQLAGQKSKLAQLDTLTQLANTKGEIQNTNDFYYYGVLVTQYASVALHTGTVDEIKNGGGLHLIRKRNIPKKIMEYYNYSSIVKNVEDRMNFVDDHYRQAFIEVIDPAIFDSITDWKTSNGLTKPENNPPLRNSSIESLARLSGNATYMRVLRFRIYYLTAQLKIDGENLLKLIQKEYKLETK
ncbi:MAG: hypothetical protein ACKO96_19695 [Flammeovirgaceae bacterium]